MKHIKLFESFIKNALVTDDQKDRIIKYLRSNIAANFYWDYNDRLSDKEVDEVLAGKIADVETEIYNNNMDTIGEMEDDQIKKAVDECGLDPDDFDIGYLRDEFAQYTSINFRFEDLLKNTGLVPVMVVLYSNYDVINSHYFETEYDGYSYEKSYFGAVVDALNLNPAKVKQLFLDKDVEMSGEWPDLKERDGKELVKYEEFFEEDVNRSASACQMMMLGKLDLSGFVDGNGVKSIVIPKGNPVGYYSSSEGGGSLFDMTLSTDVTIDLTKTGKTKYDRWDLEAAGSGKYSIASVYGVDSDFFKSPIKIVSYREVN